MKESTLTGVLAGAAVVTAGLAFASFRILKGDAEFAEVLAVQPVVESVQRSRQECPEELIVDRAAPRASAAVTTSVALASPIAQTASAATAAPPNPTTNCRTVYDSILETVGYDVVYRLGDREGTVRLDYDPGDRIPVKDGELVLQPPTP